MPPFTSPACSACMPVRNASAADTGCDGAGSAGPRLRFGAGTRVVPLLLPPGMFGTASDGTATLGGASAGAVTAEARGITSTLTGGVTPLLFWDPVPSNAKAETRLRPTVNTAAGSRRSDIRIGPDLLGATRMRHGTAARRADLLGIFPKVPRAEIRLARLPAGAPRSEEHTSELQSLRHL